MTTAMLVALGKGDIKTVEDFAGSVPDELDRLGPSARTARRPATPARSTSSTCPAPMPRR